MAEINEKLKFDGIYVIENFVDDVELIKLTDDYNKLFSQDIKGTRKNSHPPGACVRIKLDKCDANEFPQIRAIFCSEVFATIARGYLPKGSVINSDIVAGHDTKNGPITDVHFDTVRSHLSGNAWTTESKKFCFERFLPRAMKPCPVCCRRLPANARFAWAFHDRTRLSR